MHLVETSEASQRWRDNRRPAVPGAQTWTRNKLAGMAQMLLFCVACMQAWLMLIFATSFVKISAALGTAAGLIPIAHAQRLRSTRLP